ncbi:hypothetical protein GY50_0831 [Dehalococcoides mccartyi GY50]|nr:hypothetical protein GY50_0831 [Dehalococcoides mccartyi GY50]AOV99455.1 hypothetical protein DCWBC2_0817 [Dehalococcoides mccartyi]
MVYGLTVKLKKYVLKLYKWLAFDFYLFNCYPNSIWGKGDVI